MKKIAAVAVCLLVATAVFGDERAGAVYISGGVNVLHQDGVEGQASTVYVTAPGGTTVGWNAAGGFFLLRYLSVEGEFATTGTMSAREPSRYDMTFNERRRDRFAWAALRFHFPVAAAFDIEPVAGAGIVSTLVTSQTERAPCSGCPGTTQLDPEVTETVRARPVFVFGCDARIGADHVALVPWFRIMRAGSYPDWPTYYPGGVSLTTVGGGAAIRVTF